MCEVSCGLEQPVFGGSAVTLRCDVVWYTYLCREWLFWGVLQR